MKNITVRFSPQELTEVLQAYNTIRHFLDKLISPNELYLEKFLKGLHEANTEIEAGQFEEVDSFEKFIS
jgi:hypothetical protein